MYIALNTRFDKLVKSTPPFKAGPPPNNTNPSDQLIRTLSSPGNKNEISFGFPIAVLFARHGIQGARGTLQNLAFQNLVDPKGGVLMVFPIEGHSVMGICKWAWCEGSPEGIPRLDNIGHTGTQHVMCE